MKLSRNVLVGSLATVGMVLGSLAPAVVAQAATTSGVVGSDGNVTGTKASDGKSASTVKTNSVNLEGTDTAASPLIDLAAGSYNVGQINASFAPSDKNVFLKLGDTASSTTPDKASVKSYNANITWTLTAKPTKTTGTTQP